MRGRLRPVGGTGLPSVNNPTGCRGSVSDFNVSTIGRRPPALWNQSPEPTRTAEYTAGGFARLPYDNVGVQYGLNAPLSGTILAEQFVDLNEKIGTVDDRADYAAVIPPLTDAQWARLVAAFPEGVCDYSLPGVGQEASIPWMTFENGPGRTPLGDPPVSTPVN